MGDRPLIEARYKDNCTLPSNEGGLQFGRFGLGREPAVVLAREAAVTLSTMPTVEFGTQTFWGAVKVDKNGKNTSRESSGKLA